MRTLVKYWNMTPGESVLVAQPIRHVYYLCQYWGRKTGWKFSVRRVNAQLSRITRVK